MNVGTDSFGLEVTAALLVNHQRMSKSMVTLEIIMDTGYTRHELLALMSTYKVSEITIMNM